MTIENDWKKVKIGEDHFIYERTIDPEIQKLMPPPGSKPFTQVTLGEFTIEEIKNTIKLVKGIIHKD